MRHKKRWLACVLAIALLLPAVPTASAAAFTDISGHWAQSNIQRAADNNWFRGISDTQFAPDMMMTRGMFVKVLGEYSGDAIDRNAGNTKFKDVDASKYYAPYVNWAYQSGIVNGTSSTTFSPNTAITREQIAVMFVNYANAKKLILPRNRKWNGFADVNSCANYALDSIYTLYRTGVINGMPNNRFSPKTAATRAQCAALLCRFFDVTHQLPDASVQVPLISHSGYNLSAGENTLYAYELAAQYEYQYVETDIRFTADNVPVLIHDATIDRTSNGKGTVSKMTYQQLLQYDFSEGKAQPCQITSFETFMQYCSQMGLTAYVELKTKITAQQAQILMNIARSANMQDHCIWISYEYDALTMIRSTLHYAPLSLVCNQVTDKVITQINQLKNGKNTVTLCALYTQLTAAQKAKLIRNNIGLIVWPVDRYQDCIQQVNSSAQAITTNAITRQILYPHS